MKQKVKAIIGYVSIFLKCFKSSYNVTIENSFYKTQSTKSFSNCRYYLSSLESSFQSTHNILNFILTRPEIDQILFLKRDHFLNDGPQPSFKGHKSLTGFACKTSNKCFIWHFENFPNLTRR